MNNLNQHKLATLISLIAFLLMNAEIFAQYDSTHYFPPLYSRSSDMTELGKSYLYLSTNKIDSFEVHVIEATGDTIASQYISKTNPAEVNLGYAYGAIGIVDASQINVPLTDEGFIATASQPFFANLRHIAGSQGMSLTGKGKWAKGTRFRSGHMYTRVSHQQSQALKSHQISVMATEDNTTITFSEMKSGVIFHGTPVTGNTSDEITVTLNKYQSYVIATHLDEPNATGNDTLVNGVLITSDLPVVVNSGSWCGGSNQTNGSPSRDIGMDQIVPVNVVGREYVVMKRYSALEEETERVIVIADVNNTKIFINGNATADATLNSGEFYIIPASRYDANNIMFIEATQPVYVYQSTNSSDTYAHAQAMNFIPPANCLGNNEVTLTRLDSFNGFPSDIDIIANKGSVVHINGGPTSVSPIALTGNDDYEVYRLSGMTGDLNIRSTETIRVSSLTNNYAKGAAAYFSGFGTQSAPSVKAVSSFNEDQLLEGCIGAKFVVTKPQELLEQDVTYTITYSGTAVMGTDYNQLIDMVTIPSGSTTASVNVDAYNDGVQEIQEFIVASIDLTECGGEFVSDTLKIINYTPMEITLTADNAAVCPDSGDEAEISVEVTGGVPPYSYHWVEEDVWSQTITVSPESTSTYSVQVIDACDNMQVSDELEISILCDVTIYVPNAFTPDGNNLNEVFSPVMDGFAEDGYAMYIFNRWGELVFETHDMNIGWNGSYANTYDKVQDGMYTWKIQARLQETDEVKLYTGHVSVLK